jgi:hypothetical protein
MFRRVDGKLVKVPSRRKVLVYKEGHELAVLRPLTKEAAQASIDEARALVGQDDPDGSRFREILGNRGQMIFVGLLAKEGRVVDPQTLVDVGPAEPGDSFIRADDLSKFSKVETASA